MDSKFLLKLDYSLSEIFLNGDTCKELVVEPGDVVRARRNVADLVKERILAGGIFLLLSSFGIGRLLPQEFLGFQGTDRSIMVVILSIFITFLVVRMDIRRRVG